MAMVYGYGRASTHKQALTREAQQHKIEAYVSSTLPEHNYAGMLYDEAVSGSKPMFERPAGLRLWALVQPGDHVVWTKLDRAFRSVPDGSSALQMFHAKGVFVHSLDLGLNTGTPTGRLIATILLAVAEFEREVIADRTREGIYAKMRAGKPVTCVSPVGWRKVGKGRHSSYMADPIEREQARQITMLRRNGKSLLQIVSIFKAVGTRPNGKFWNKNSIPRAIAAYEAGFPKHFSVAEAHETVAS
jgi:DNA invertase Pin-like site-specific DNA recombinase